MRDRDQRVFWRLPNLDPGYYEAKENDMSQTEMLSYLSVAVLGSAIAGYAGGLIGILAVFCGLGIVGFTEMLVVLNQAEA
jgi:hypothetical protein